MEEFKISDKIQSLQTKTRNMLEGESSDAFPMLSAFLDREIPLSVLDERIVDLQKLHDETKDLKAKRRANLALASYKELKILISELRKIKESA